ncbi:acidic mammalian chitinase-like isoform X2 [Neoarius graeffei]|nr:acidic mammalian chitinase-like isoform X2 [Neoarius graeffei]
MTYDFHGSWESITGHNSPLYQWSQETGNGIYLNTNYSVTYWKDQGAPVEKLRMGFATYGRTFQLSSTASGLGAPTSGPASAGTYTKQAGFWSYYEICSFLQGTSIQWIQDQKVPYGTKSDWWVGFDTKESFNIKVTYLKDNKLGGAFVWALDLGNFSGQFCGLGKYPLISELKKQLTSASTAPPTAAPTAPPTEAPTAAPTEAPTAPPTAAPTAPPTEAPTAAPAAPPTEAPTAAPPAAPTAPPTEAPIADPAPAVPPRYCKAKKDGTYKNPFNKQSFIQCVDRREIVHLCPAGTTYNKHCQFCK